MICTVTGQLHLCAPFDPDICPGGGRGGELSLVLSVTMIRRSTYAERLQTHHAARYEAPAWLRWGSALSDGQHQKRLGLLHPHPTKCKTDVKFHCHRVICTRTSSRCVHLTASGIDHSCEHESVDVPSKLFLFPPRTGTPSNCVFMGLAVRASKANTGHNNLPLQVPHDDIAWSICLLQALDY